jgi:hypothetical protein
VRKIWFFIAALVITLIPITTFASVDRNFIIPEDDYNLLLLFYTPEYISTMTYDEYLSFMSMDIDPEKVERVSKYYKVVTNYLTHEVEKEEVTEAEYEAYEVPVQDRSLFYETGYEKLVLSFTHISDTSNYVSYTGIWKVIPSVRSYDNIGIRVTGFSVDAGSQITKQIYKMNGTNYSINYPYGGINSQYFADGYGVSMGLIGSTVTALQCTTSASLTVDSYPAYVFGAYEHAVDTITLNDAKDYYLGPGSGNVFIFGDDAAGHYDGMLGLYTYIDN